jgi:hypothetical protein
VVLGQSTTATVRTKDPGSWGYFIEGANERFDLGFGVSRIDDVNGDSVDDLLVGSSTDQALIFSGLP